jgi:hypothetical protein
MEAMRALSACTASLLLAACLHAAQAHAAGGLRCDTELIRRGMTPLEVVERCGEPHYELGWTDFRYPGLFVRVDEWTYELGRNKFRRLLTFENGRLIRIETRGKPTGGLPAPKATGVAPPVMPPTW